jgi:hypothetical protein
MSLCSKLFNRASKSKGRMTKNRYSVKEGAESTSLSAEGALDTSNDEALARSFAVAGAKTQRRVKFSDDQSVSSSDDASEVGAAQFVMLARTGRELDDNEALALIEGARPAPDDKKKKSAPPKKKSEDAPARIADETFDSIASDNGATK